MAARKTNMLDKGVVVELDKTRHMKFDLNALVDLQEEHGNVIDVFTAGLEKQDFKLIRNLLFVSLRGDDPELTEQEVGAMITMNNLTDVIGKLHEALSASVPQSEEGKK